MAAANDNEIILSLRGAQNWAPQDLEGRPPQSLPTGNADYFRDKETEVE